MISLYSIEEKKQHIRSRDIDLNEASNVGVVYSVDFSMTRTSLNQFW